MIIATIILLIALIGVVMLPKMKKHESCKPVNTLFDIELTDENRQDLSDAEYIIRNNVLPHILDYVRGKNNRTVAIQCIMQDIQGNESYMYLVDDKKWDYICNVNPHNTHTVKSPHNEVITISGGFPMGISDL